MKNSNDIIGNPSRDLPACSAVPKPNRATAYPVVGNKVLLDKQRKAVMWYILILMN